MHAISHSLAHRAPPASRTRVRWQPYNNISTIQAPPPSSSFCPLTPTSSVSPNSPPATPCESDRLRQAPPRSVPTISKETHIRDSTKHKYALGLVDQAVKSLTEIWPTHQIPSVFLTPSRVAAPQSCETGRSLPPIRPAPLRRHNTQLPSPVSPSTRPSPSTPSASLLAVPGTASQAGSCEDGTSQCSLVPIKGFVHEVLRRSRTSGGILQTALCYLEAIRDQVPDMARLEKLGLGVKGEPESANRVIREAEFDTGMNIDDVLATATASSDAEVRTIRVSELSPPPSLYKPVTPSLEPLPTLPPLPSPLLCPRRAFLASLILASKFTQDKCYSNRAWAKLSGLPPREIGRCERALGEALDWRLWVGKLPDHPPSATTTSRPLARSRSDGSLLSTHPKSVVSMPSSFPSPTAMKQVAGAGLRRCTTLPADIYDPVPSFLDTQTYQVPEIAVQSTQSNFASAFLHEDSPVDSTPGLSYSPASTESSSYSDQTMTIQSGFIDECAQPFSVAFASSANDLESADCQTCPYTSDRYLQFLPSSEGYPVGSSKVAQPFPVYLSDHPGYTSHL